MLTKSIIFDEVASQLDIPASMYKLALERYNSVAGYLKECGISAEIYPQGSFRLGTIIRPYKNGVDADYDIDLVCQINVNKSDITPSSVKNLVGNALKRSNIYKNILDDEGRRCWTLIYAERSGVGFHLDILPSVQESRDIIGLIISQYRVDSFYASNAIAITEKNGDYKWVSSNPRGYALWFDSINEPFYRLVEKRERNKLFEQNKNIYASIEEVPPQLIRTPFQKVIQLLKRHRDVRFAGNALEDDKPISMIITTIASQVVKNEGYISQDTDLLLNKVIYKISEYAELLKTWNASISQAANAIIKRDSSNRWYIPNPVNPAENFAERWNENNNRKAIAFFTWVNWVISDLTARQFETNELNASFGKDIAEKAYTNYTSSNPKYSVTPVANIVAPSKPWRF